MKPKIFIDYLNECIKIESDTENEITITEIHSFFKDMISVVYDFHKRFPDKLVGMYIDNAYTKHLLPKEKELLCGR
jgi:hypothetical protein